MLEFCLVGLITKSSLVTTLSQQYFDYTEGARMNFWQYIATNYTEILVLLLEHIKLTAISVGLAILIVCLLAFYFLYVKSK